MLLTVQRHTLAPTAMLGDLLVEGARFCYTLEPRPDRPQHPAIPAGEYRLTVEPTHNPALWTPYGDRCLPHLWGVPGREGIEMHAGNHATDTEGCLLVGFTQQAESIASSRDALRALIDLLVHGGPHGAQHQIRVLDPAK